MSIRFTGLLAVLLSLLGGYYYLFEVRGRGDRSRAAYLATRVMPVATGEVRRLTLRMGDSTIVVERVSPRGWEIEVPLQTPADPGEIEAVLRNLRELGNEQVVADSVRIQSGEVGLADFGLSNPLGYIAVEMADGRRDTLYWGDRSPTGSYHYVRRAGRLDVMTTRAWSHNPFKRGVFGLRDRRVATVLPDSVRSIEIRSGPSSVVVSRALGVWRLEQPVRDLADQVAVNRVVRRLAGGRAVAIGAEMLTDPQTYGLSPPRVQVLVDHGPVLGVERISVGRRSDETRYPPSYLHNPELSPLFIVDSTFVADMMKTASDLRFKTIFRFERKIVDRVRLEQGSQAIECRRDSTSNEWQVFEPKLHIVLQSKVENFIDQVHTLSAKAFVADSLSTPKRWGLRRPSAHIALWAGNRLVREVRIGAVERRIFAKADHRAEVVELTARDAKRLNLELISVVPDSVTADTALLRTRSGVARD